MKYTKYNNIQKHLKNNYYNKITVVSIWLNI